MEMKDNKRGKKMEMEANLEKNKKQERENNRR